ncbi:MAG: hypothetical protein O6942_08115, partial [Bacteroidetes bacterium]|nr:hypothetical protein [Bacteroidota bacterium]
MAEDRSSKIGAKKDAEQLNKHASDGAPVGIEYGSPDDSTVTMTVPSPVAPSLLNQYTAHYPDWAKDFARKYFT